jgi:VWFA-related protein
MMSRGALSMAMVLAAGLVVAAQQPVMRSSTDLISVDVQVVDHDGNPVAGLTPDQFHVEIGGRRRTVELAEMIRTAVTTSGGEAVPLPADSRAEAILPPQPAGPDARQQTLMIAVDAQTFTPGVSRGLVTTAQDFVRALPATDSVGLYTYPLGPKVEPTTDRAALVKAMDGVVGQKEPATSYEFNVRNSEIVDWFADPREAAAIVARYCGARDPGCSARLGVEMATHAGLIEAQAQADLGRLRDLIDGMAPIAGRKVIVLVSAGLTISDRPAGRPDVADLAIQIGEAAARANVAIYTLYVDNSVLELFSAERRQAVKSSVGLARDSDLAERWLDEFSGASGGTLMKVLTGSGEQAFARIVRETSAYYLLGIDATEGDRSGRAQRIKVKVDAKGVTVRHREWVVVPRPVAP